MDEQDTSAALNWRIRGSRWWINFQQHWPGWTIIFHPAEPAEWIDWGSQTIWLSPRATDPERMAVHAVMHLWRHFGQRDPFTDADEDEADFYALWWMTMSGTPPASLGKAA